MSVEPKHATTAFLEKGKCPDEVEFQFSEDKKLYVSKGFLIYCSPVFEKMFSPNFKEGATGTVNLETKSYDDFLEFLCIMNPGEPNQVNKDNVFNVLEMAEEYQAEHLVRDCKNVMERTMITIVQKYTRKQQYCIADHAEDLIVLFKILSASLLFSYTDLNADCITSISRFPSTILRDTILKCPKYHTCNLTDNCSKVKEMYENIPDYVKLRLLSERLKLIETREFIPF